MENQKIFRDYSFPVILMIAFLLLIRGIKSAVYTVGDEEKWDSGIDYGSWSQQYNFSTGDTLVFKYAKGQHNVYEVKEGTYQSCNTSSGVIAKYKSGNDEVTLTQAKKYWFICNVVGHCFGGMRFGIDVKENSNANSTSLPPPPPPTESSNSCVSFVVQRWNIGMYIVASAILLLK